MRVRCRALARTASWPTARAAVVCGLACSGTLARRPRRRAPPHARAARTSALAGRARASSRGSTDSARPLRPRRRSTALGDASRRRLRATRAARGRRRGAARRSASSAAAAAAVGCGRLASSSVQPCVSAHAASATRRDSAGNTSSIREASDQSSGSRSITSSSTPTVQGASAAAGFQSAQAGSALICSATTPSCQGLRPGRAPRRSLPAVALVEPRLSSTPSGQGRGFDGGRGLDVR